MVGYFREYTQHMSDRSASIRSLLSKQASFLWTPAHEAEFCDLKRAVLFPSIILSHPNWENHFEVHCNASKKGCGAILAQYKDGKLRPIRFASRAFNETESLSPTTYQELFAVKWHWNISIRI